ncbi:CamS family sex pheromone protein [Lactobacillus sp. 3B(2020)]|uniref:CamS family sex pheromone protein n=1 Tax=Lactobacillus sp. 3B(2020) TaxID=2695882 RepID=UPI0015DF9845|nr:CamS family sex pheromone protein [Lactobacillus sp. 3B(2020)]QLL71039.1 CamS family sex pheromone protein [Lactobacillus sp. 3B(2020)]
MGLALAACGNKKSNDYSTTGSATGTYQAVIKDGHYRTSKARGVAVQQNDNTYNQKSFENGLINIIAKKFFSTKSYIFQEGQYLDSGTVTNWLGRKTAKNPTGLNPAEGKKSDPNPLYVQQIEEQDYMQQSGGSLKLKGVVIGIGINSEYQYQKKTDGPYYTKNISNAEVQSEGKAAAAKVLKRLRAKPELKKVPIVIALYKQAGQDSLVGGTFFAYTKASGNKIGSWTALNYKNAVLPKASSAASANSNSTGTSGAFSNFKSQIQNFFPNISGVTAQAQYKDGTLQGMHVTVTTQFYSQTEINSFTGYIVQAAKKYLPNGVPIDIKIQSDSGIQAVVYRDSGSSKWNSHVFGSY